MEGPPYHLDYFYEPQTDIITINGRRYDGELFRIGLEPTPDGEYLRMVRGQDGLLTLFRGKFKDGVHPDEHGAKRLD